MSTSTLSKHRVDRKEDAISLDDGFHRFGCIWDEEGYTFYVDGVQSGLKLTEAVSDAPQFILVATEVGVSGVRNGILGIYKDYKNPKIVKMTNS